MSAHTPGPWEAVEGCPTPNGPIQATKTYIGVVATHETRQVVALCGDAEDLKKRAVTEADARLIAAAPELLDLVKRIAWHFADTDAPLGLAAAALIAKVDGQ